MIRVLEEDTSVYRNLKKLRGSDAQEASLFLNSSKEVDEIVDYICKNNRIDQLCDMLNDERQAAFCMLHLGSFLQSAVLHKRQMILDLLISHSSGCDLVFHQTLVNLVKSNIKVSDRELDRHISALIDAGLNSEHLAQALRHCSQNEVATRALLRNGADVNITGKRGHTALFFFFRRSSCFGDNLDNYAIFRNHIQKLQIVGIPLSEENVKLFEVMQEKYEPGYSYKYRFETDPAILELKKCKEECEKLKETKLNRYISYHDLLFADENKLSALVGNEDFRNTILNGEFKSKFPMYGCLLKLQFKKGLLRKALLDSAQLAMRFVVTRQDLPDVCSMEILKLLNNGELVNLIKALFIE